jgi:hypothetical protein
VKLYEVVEDELNVIKGKGTIKVARELYTLVRRELAVNIFADF